MTTLQRHLDAGDTLRITVAATDAGFYSSRKAAGARTVTINRRPENRS